MCQAVLGLARRHIGNYLHSLTGLRIGWTEEPSPNRYRPMSHPVTNVIIAHCDGRVVTGKIQFMPGTHSFLLSCSGVNYDIKWNCWGYGVIFGYSTEYEGFLPMTREHLVEQEEPEWLVIIDPSAHLQLM
jgi:hypothetical protein